MLYISEHLAKVMTMKVGGRTIIKQDDNVRKFGIIAGHLIGLMKDANHLTIRNFVRLLGSLSFKDKRLPIHLQ